MAKSRSTAALLAFFGGALGLHKFYLGETGKGIMYIFLSYMLIGLFRIPVTIFLGFIDAVKLLSMSNAEFHERYDEENRRSRRATRRERRSTPRERSSNEDKRYRYKEPKRSRSNPFKTSAKKKFKDYDLEEAIKDYEQALVIQPEDAEIHFEMAAVNSLLEKKEKAYHHLSKSISLGWKDAEQVLTMDEFAYLRIQPDFDNFRSRGFTTTEQKTIEAPKDDLLKEDLLLSQLNKLKNLRERGLLSDNEFLKEKEKLFRK